MFVELTELLTCPRCGPVFGLVLLAQHVEDRRVYGGWLGCPNCRTDYPITDGVADLRLQTETATDAAPPVRDDELAIKIAALSGLAEGPGYFLLGERLSHTAPSVAEMLPGLELIAMRTTPDESIEQHGISRVLSDDSFPLAEYRLEAAAVAPDGDPALVAAAARRVKPQGRLILFEAEERDVEQAERSGLTVAAREGPIVVAERRIKPVVELGQG